MRTFQCPACSSAVTLADSHAGPDRCPICGDIGIQVTQEHVTPVMRPSGSTSLAVLIADAASRPPFSDSYELGPLLGSGGAGMVFRAAARKTGQVVALKVLSTTEEPAVMNRFMLCPPRGW